MSTSARGIDALVVLLVVALPFAVIAAGSSVYQVTMAYGNVLFSRGNAGLPTFVYIITGTISLLAVITSLVLPFLLYMRRFRNKIGDLGRHVRELSDYRKRKRKGLLRLSE